MNAELNVYAVLISLACDILVVAPLVLLARRRTKQRQEEAIERLIWQGVELDPALTRTPKW